MPHRAGRQIGWSGSADWLVGWTSSRCGQLAAQDGVDEGRWLEWRQVIGALTEADELHGHA
jgi:hypothetical protein